MYVHLQNIRCSYKYDDLVRVIPEVLNSIPITTIRKFAKKSWRYMDAYDKGLEGRMARLIKIYQISRHTGYTNHQLEMIASTIYVSIFRRAHILL